MTEAELAEIETRQGIVLPDEPRGSLAHVHGGGCGPGDELAVMPSAAAAQPCPFGDADARRVIANPSVGLEVDDSGDAGERGFDWYERWLATI